MIKLRTIFYFILFAVILFTGCKSYELANNDDLEDTVESEAGPSPYVISTDPSSDATSAAVSTKIKAIFNEAMDSTTITKTSFTLVNSSSKLVISTVSYQSSTNTATLTPTTSLNGTSTYTATISTAITTSAGDPLNSEKTWRFTTASPKLSEIIVGTWTIANDTANTIYEDTGEITFNSDGTYDLVSGSFAAIGENSTSGAICSRIESSQKYSLVDDTTDSYQFKYTYSSTIYSVNPTATVTSITGVSFVGLGCGGSTESTSTLTKQ